MITRHQQGFTVVHPIPAFPSPVTPDGTGILGLYPELHTLLSRTQQRMSGRGRAWTLPGLRPWHQPASFDVLTHNARPHFAKIWLICVRPHGRATQKPAARNRRSVRPRSGTPVALRYDRWPRLSREIRPIWRSCLSARVADHSAQMWPICAARIVVLTRVRSLVFAGGVHRGLAGERVHDIVCPAGPYFTALSRRFSKI